jgi:hypothetical protein
MPAEEVPFWGKETAEAVSAAGYAVDGFLYAVHLPGRVRLSRQDQPASVADEQAMGRRL